MIERAILFVFFLFILSNSTYGQLSSVDYKGIGYFYDEGGSLINFYIDESYRPKNQLQFIGKIKDEKIRTFRENTIATFDNYLFTFEYRKGYYGNYKKVFFVTYKNNKRERLKYFKGGFQKQLITLFPEYTIPLHLRESDKLRISFTYSIIRLLQLEYSHNLGRVTYLNKISDFLATNVDARYYLKVDSITAQKVFLKKYSNKGLLLVRNTILLENPNKKNDWFHFYNDQGIPTKSYYYDANEIDSIRTYYSNGTLFESFFTQNFDHTYFSVKDSAGNEILDSNNNGLVSFYDFIQHRRIFKQYKNGKLLSTFYITDNTKNYLYTEKPASYAFFDQFYDSFNKEFKPKMKVKSTLNEGVSLFLCLIDEEGKIVTAKIMQSVNQNQDERVIEWLKTRTKKIFDPALIEQKNVPQELLIPLSYYTYAKDRYRFGLFFF
jgi:hypothetical protein